MPYNVFSRAADHLGLECTQCQRVIRVERGRLGSAIRCVCGHESQAVNGDTMSWPTPVRRAERPALNTLEGQLMAVVRAVMAGGLLLFLGTCAYLMVKPADPPPAKSAEQVALETKQAAHGTLPLTNGFTGKVLAVDRFLKPQLNDPDSLEYVQWYGPMAADHAGVKCWKVTAVYRARNAFGGMVPGTLSCWIRDEKVIASESL